MHDGKRDRNDSADDSLHLRELGGAIAVTCVNAKAQPHIRPRVERLGAESTAPLDVGQPGRMVDSSAAGFARAMDISCHAFVRKARLADPLMNDGGALVRMSYGGAQMVIAKYGIMGPVMATPEGSVRHMAAELGMG
jgi:enoyl-[acyl-carrier protein] reductase I